MTITSDWQAELSGSLLIGTGTDYVWKGGFAGSGFEVRSADLSRGVQVPGASTSFDVIEKRLFRIPVQIEKSTQAACQQSLQTLKAGWKPTSADTYLDVRMPGTPETTMRLYGRPRGVLNEQWDLTGRILWVVLEFAAVDPFFYGAAAAISADSSSPIPIVNAGDASTRRCTLTVVGSGGTPVITNPNVGHITFSGALSGTATIDLDAQTVTVASASREDLVDPSSTWFTIAAGTNNVTFTGCTSVASSTRPAYH